MPNWGHLLVSSERRGCSRSRSGGERARALLHALARGHPGKCEQSHPLNPPWSPRSESRRHFRLMRPAYCCCTTRGRLEPPAGLAPASRRYRLRRLLVLWRQSRRRESHSHFCFTEAADSSCPTPAWYPRLESHQRLHDVTVALCGWATRAQDWGDRPDLHRLSAGSQSACSTLRTAAMWCSPSLTTLWSFGERSEAPRREWAKECTRKESHLHFAIIVREFYC